MNKIKFFCLASLMLISLSVKAQFHQDRSEYEYMFKAEMGYSAFVSNVGNPGAQGFYISDLRHMAGLNIINGVCIKQDFFVGLGLGYDYVARPDNITDGWHSALGFVDFDFRPLDEEWSPMVIAKLGAHYMMGNPNTYGTTIAPYAEVGLGVNWFFNYVLSNMERNYRSIYLEVAVAYTQQTAFIPVRFGIRF